MRTIDYDKQDKNTGNTDNQIATDEAMHKKFGNLRRAYEAGFSASDGVRGGTMETNGLEKYPEIGDDSKPSRTSKTIKSEDPGLADN